MTDTASTPVVRVVDVYVYRLDTGGHPEFLLLHRAPDRRYGGTWRMIGGKIAAGETAWQAARRELEEETGMRPLCFWTLPSVNAFYEWQTDRLNHAPAFAAEVEGQPALDDEHVAYEWVTADEACSRLVWPEQRRLLRLTAEILTGTIPSDWIIPLET